MIKSSTSVASDQSVMFADWAKGLLEHTTSDPLTTERHVSSMVEVSLLFKLQYLELSSFALCLIVPDTPLHVTHSRYGTLLFPVIPSFAPIQRDEIPLNNQLENLKLVCLK